MLKMTPLISIITVNFNDKIGLERTLESVFSQNFRNFEYLVIDGGSNDGSKELLEKNSEKINYWVSEPDKGIYNAMNKGISVAKGEYLIFLNSGDHFKNENSLEIAQKYLDKDITYFFQKHIINGVDIELKNEDLVDLFKIEHIENIPQISVEKEMKDKYILK